MIVERRMQVWFLLFASILLSASAPPILIAQVTDKVPRVGVLLLGSPVTSGRYTITLREALATFGHHDGRNVIVDPRYGHGAYEKLPAVAAELVSEKPNLVVAGSERALLAAKSTGADIPIVVVACDPLEKLLGSIARPGGNATGVTCVSADLIGKRLGYLKTIVPNLKCVALL